MEYLDIIEQNLKHCLGTTEFNIGKKKSGKVRDIYEFDKFLAIITTDRQSAFDKVLGKIPFKGQVLNLCSKWWFDKTSHIVQNHLIATPKPNLSIVKKCSVFPVEFIVRSYLTGTSKTSIWTHYKNGARNYCGFKLPEGLTKNQKLPELILTPTTKSDTGDSLISKQEIIEQNLMSLKDYEYVHEIAIQLFSFAEKIALDRGLILVDTKYEFGKDENGEICLIDELHTPDSSRYWILESYKERTKKGLEPEQLDKEILRKYYAEKFDIINNETLPPPPNELVVKLANTYINFYEKLTESKFNFLPYSQSYHEELKHSVTAYSENLKDFVGC